MASKQAAERKISLSQSYKIVSESIDNGINQCLPQLLECPVCFECLAPPIRLCRNGHNICWKCRPRLSNCPTCRQSFLSTRNFALETLSDRYLEPCGNSNVGCEVKKSNVQEIITHMEVCSYRLYDCEPGRNNGCTWLGRRWQLLNHIRDAHPEILVLKETNICKIRDFEKYDHGITTQVIVAHGEMFWFNHEKDSAKSNFFGSVHYIGSQENSSNFSYRLKLISRNSNGMEISYRRNTHKDNEEVTQLFQSGDCVCIPLCVANNFVEINGNFRFNLNIFKNVTDLKSSEL